MLNCSPTLTVIKVKRNASIATEQATHTHSVEKHTIRRFEGGVDCCLIYIYFIEPLMTVYFLDIL
jgi:hypothetical protein